jgi:hypothetical protein
MIALEYAAIVVVFIAAAVLYFRGFFWVAAALGIVCWTLTAHLLFCSVGPVWMSIIFVPLGLAPALFLGVHAIDVRTGFCTAPTVYSIPIAFVLGVALILATGLGVLIA